MTELTPIDPSTLRLQLLANGYSPIPNVGKQCFMTGWPSVKITPEEIEQWGRRNRRWADTGLRVENGLAVLDFDINDPEVMEDVAAELFQKKPHLAGAPVRFGKGAKEAWFVRTGEPFGRIHAHRYLAAGASADTADAHTLECFGGTASRQFGAFGAHTRNPDGSIALAYEWQAHSPLDTPIDELPEIATKAEFHEIVDLVEAIMVRHGYQQIMRSTSGENAATRVFDLTDAMRFDCNDGVTRTLEQLQRIAGDTGLRCSASWLEPGASNRDRCLVGRSRKGVVTVYETAAGKTHFPTSHAPRSGPNHEALAQGLLQLKGTGKVSKLEPAEDDDHVVVAEELLKAFAFRPSSILSVVPLAANSTTDGMTLAAFRTKMLPWCGVEFGPRGGERKLNPANIWASSKERIDVATLQLRPDKPRPTFEEDGELHINIYHPPQHGDHRAGLATFLNFIEHLLPFSDERSWFLDWLAHKIQHPEVPGPGVVMVSAKQGAGRGTLFGILSQVLGFRYVKKVDGVTLTGDGGQAQYNTWMASALLVAVDELFSGGSGAHLWQRRKAYNRIKTLVDPAARSVEIVQKTLNNYTGRTFASFIFATNHPNALPLDEDDRRLCVLRNGSLLHEVPETAKEIAQYRRGAEFAPEFIAAIFAFLCTRDVSAFRPHEPPPMFEGKRNMIDHNRTDAGDIAEGVLAEFVSDFFTRDTFLRRVRSKLVGHDEEPRSWKQDALDALLRSTWIPLGRTVAKSNGSKAQVFARDEDAAKRWHRTPQAERERLLDLNPETVAANITQLHETMRATRKDKGLLGMSVPRSGGLR